MVNSKFLSTLGIAGRVCQAGEERDQGTLGTFWPGIHSGSNATSASYLPASTVQQNKDSSDHGDQDWVRVAGEITPKQSPSSPLFSPPHLFLFPAHSEIILLSIFKLYLHLII
jgi:hypothetical protein